MPEFLIGADAVIEIGSAAAPDTLVDKSVYFKTFKTTEQIGNEDVTTFGPEDFAKVFTYLLNEQDFNADMLVDKPQGAIWKFFGDIVRQRKKVLLRIFPSGKAIGNEYWLCRVLLVNRDRTGSTSEADKGTLSLKRTGTLTEGIWAG